MPLGLSSLGAPAPSCPPPYFPSSRSSHTSVSGPSAPPDLRLTAPFLWASGPLWITSGTHLSVPQSPIFQGARLCASVPHSLGSLCLRVSVSQGSPLLVAFWLCCGLFSVPGSPVLSQGLPPSQDLSSPPVSVVAGFTSCPAPFHPPGSSPGGPSLQRGEVAPEGLPCAGLWVLPSQRSLVDTCSQVPSPAMPQKGAGCGALVP